MIRFLIKLFYKELIKIGVDNEKRIKFLTAAKDGNLEKLQQMCQEDSEILAVISTTAKYTGLHYAAENGFGNCVRFLIEKGLDKNIKDSHGKKAIDLAKQHKRTEVFQYLASLECSSDSVCPITQEPRENLEQVWFPTCCGDKGKFVSLPDFIKYLKLTDIDRCPCCNRPDIRQEIRADGYQVPDTELVRNFHDYVEMGDEENVRLCIESGCEVNAIRDEEFYRFLQSTAFVPQRGVSLLSISIKYFRYGVFLILLSHNDIDVNQNNEEGNTPLLASIEIAHYQNDTRFFNRLIERPDIDFNQHNRECLTPLATAAQWGLTHCVRELLRLGGDRILLNAEGLEDTTTALYCACKEGFEEIVDMLFRYPNIDVTKATPDGSCPLTIAVSERHYGIVSKLLSHPRIDVNQRSGKGDTALILAVSRFILNRDLILDLLHRGADPTIVAPDGATAISVLKEVPEREEQRGIEREILGILKSKCRTLCPRPL